MLRTDSDILLFAVRFEWLRQLRPSYLLGQRQWCFRLPESCLSQVPVPDPTEFAADQSVDSSKSICTTRPDRSFQTTARPRYRVTSAGLDLRAEIMWDSSDTDPFDWIT